VVNNPRPRPIAQRTNSTLRTQSAVKLLGRHLVEPHQVASPLGPVVVLGPSCGIAETLPRLFASLTRGPLSAGAVGPIREVIPRLLHATLAANDVHVCSVSARPLTIKNAPEGGR
jgi:hypothetical protein